MSEKRDMGHPLCCGIDARKGNRRSFDSLRSLRMTALEKRKTGLCTQRSGYPTHAAMKLRHGWGTHGRWLVKGHLVSVRPQSGLV